MSKYIVTASVLTVRSGPATTYKAAGYLKENDLVESLASTEDRAWEKVLAPSGLTGWCSAKYLSPVGGQGAGGPPLLGRGAVKPIGMFLRQGPASNRRIVAFLKRGAGVDLLESALDGVWVRVRTGNVVEGWCLRRHLAEESLPVPLPPETGMHRLTRSNVPLHQNPGPEYPVIGQVPGDCLVDVSNNTDDGLWKKVATHLGATGWCLSEFLSAVGEAGQPAASEEFPWMPIAFGELGVREYPGSKHNPRVQEYLASTVLGSGPALPDETHWCAAFVNWCVEKAGIASNNSPMVQSWARWGQALQAPRRGCIVTFKWEDGGSHVAFYTGASGDKVFALGGNQNDGVWIMAYPRQTVSACRIPPGWPLEAPAAPRSG